ncbi:MAG: hypothetical protein ACRDO1_21325 [Nocardioidaceae bacterium]
MDQRQPPPPRRLREPPADATEDPDPPADPPDDAEPPAEHWEPL